MAVIVKLPKNRQSRLSEDVWLGAEAMARYIGASSPREGLETAFRNYLLTLRQTDPKFAEIWEKVKEEGIEDA